MIMAPAQGINAVRIGPHTFIQLTIIRNEIIEA